MPRKGGINGSPTNRQRAEGGLVSPALDHRSMEQGHVHLARVRVRGRRKALVGGLLFALGEYGGVHSLGADTWGPPWRMLGSED